MRTLVNKLPGIGIVLAVTLTLLTAGCGGGGGGGTPGPGPSTRVFVNPNPAATKAGSSITLTALDENGTAVAVAWKVKAGGTAGGSVDAIGKYVPDTFKTTATADVVVATRTDNHATAEVVINVAPNAGNGNIIVN